MLQKNKGFRFPKKVLHMNAGFTLIEVLIVLAIIGILVSYILASLSEARRRSRDTQRVTDIRELRSALELYFDAFKSYPPSTGICDTANGNFMGLQLLAPEYISVIRTDPITRDCFAYATPTASGAQLTYHLGISLEQSTHIAFDADADCYSSAAGAASRGPCPGWIGPAGFLVGGFDGNSAGQCRAQQGGLYCYDRTPE